MTLKKWIIPILPLHMLILSGVCILIIFYFIFLPTPKALICPFSLLLVVLAGWIALSWKKVTGSLFDPYMLFIVAAVLFNGGYAFLEILGLADSADCFLRGRVPDATIIASLLLVILSLAAFHAGGLLAVGVQKLRMPAADTSMSYILRRQRRAARIIGWILVIISIFPFFILLRDALSTVMTGGYFALYQRGTGTGFDALGRVLATFMVPGLLFLLAGCKGRPVVFVFSSICLLSYIMTEFFMGSRIRATMPLLAYVWVWHRSIRPLPSTVLLIGGGILMFGIFPLVKVIRNIEGAARLTVGTYFDAISELGNTAVLILSEMGGSMITIAWTLELVPSMRDFDWGLSYLYAVLTLVPNLFWDIHPTVAHGLLANWLVWEKVPEFAVTGGGYGYSFIAEAFLNFGWIGAPVALCVIGYLLSRFTLWANATNQPIRVAAVASFMSFFLIFARGESGSVIRALVWYSLLPYGLAYFLTRVKTLYRKRQDTRT